MKQMSFIFPETKFVRQNTVNEQLSHLGSEVDEAKAEIAKDDDLGKLVEGIDAVHSAETLLRILVKEYGQEAVWEATQYVIAKNQNRGYYP